MEGTSIFIILLSSILVNNFVLSRFLGICPFVGVSKKVDTAVGMGFAVTFVMAIASIITWLIQHLILVPLKIEFMQTIAFILVIGVYLPLITTNCAVLGVAILNITENYSLIESIFNGIGGALGFMIAIVLFAGIRERLETSNIPVPMKGFPIALVSAGLMSIAFMGFQGLV